MLRYLIKRFCYAIAVLMAVSLVTFFLSTLAPGDILLAHLSLDGSQSTFRERTFGERMSEYHRAAERIDLHLPAFYFSVEPACVPDTLHRIIRKEERQNFRQLFLRHGSLAHVHAWRTQVLSLINTAESAPRAQQQAGTDAEFLLTTADTGRIHYLLQAIAHIAAQDTGDLREKALQLTDSYHHMEPQRTGVRGLMPAFRWHGIQNQYHRWVARVIKGDLGRSLVDGRPVKSKIREAIHWTLTINLIAILLAFGIAIPLGVGTARRVGTWSDKVVASVLFAFYAMPSFWLAMLCIVFLTTQEYGAWTDLFPSGGTGRLLPGMTWWEILQVRASHLTLPVFCILAGSLAYLTRQMRGSMLRELRQDYIRMVRAKGVSENAVHWRHAFRNALFPMITLVGSAFPAAVSGSVIIEVIFSIPGMGRLLYMSIVAKDWPVVYAMVLLASMLTVTGYFVADMLYRSADPRVRFETKPA